MTPLPEPYKKVRIVEDEDYPIDLFVYTPKQMREYGKTERQRALEEAALLCDGIAQRNWATILAAQCAEAIRAFKEKP